MVIQGSYGAVGGLTRMDATNNLVGKRASFDPSFGFMADVEGAGSCLCDVMLGSLLVEDLVALLN